MLAADTPAEMLPRSRAFLEQSKAYFSLYIVGFLDALKPGKQSQLRPFLEMALKEPTRRQIKIMRIFLSGKI